MFSSIDQFFWHANIAEGLENNILNINHDCGDCDDWLVQRGCLAILHVNTVNGWRMGMVYLSALNEAWLSSNGNGKQQRNAATTQ